MGYLSRKPNSNDITHSRQDFPWGADEFFDDTALLLANLGKRCNDCKRVTKNQFLANGLCPLCRREDNEEFDIYKPEYMNLYELTGYVKAHLSDLSAGTFSDQGVTRGKAWTTELILRLEEIQKELPADGQPQSTFEAELAPGLIVALHKTVLASELTSKDEHRLLWHLRKSIGIVKQAFQEFLDSPEKANLKNIQQLRDFCVQLCLHLPFKERFKLGRLPMEIKLPPKTRRAPRRNYMADGQPGEAD